MSCPICGRAADAKYKPFCSRRCSDIDLGKWLTGAYAIPVEAIDDENPVEEAGDRTKSAKFPN
jgi:uncharacterized protein